MGLREVPVPDQPIPKIEFRPEVPTEAPPAFTEGEVVRAAVREVRASNEVVVDLKGARFVATVETPVAEGDTLVLRVETPTPELRLRVVSTVRAVPTEAPPPAEAAKPAPPPHPAAEALRAYGATPNAATVQLVERAASQSTAPEAARAVVASLVAAGFPPPHELVSQIAGLVDPAAPASMEQMVAALPPATIPAEDLAEIEALAVRVNEELEDPTTREALRAAKGPTPVALLDRIEEATQSRVEAEPTLKAIDAALSAVEEVSARPTLATEAQGEAERIAAKLTPENVETVADEIAKLPPERQEAVREALLSVRVSKAIALEAREEALEIVRRMQMTPPRPATPKPQATPQQTQPTPQATQPTPQVAPSTPQVAQPTPQDARQTPQVVQATPQVAQPTPQATQPTPPVSQPTPQPAQPTPQVAQPAPQIAQPTPQIAHQTPQIAYPTPQIAQQTPPAAQQTTQIAQQTPPVVPQTPPVAQPTPPVVQQPPQVFQPTPQVAQPTPPPSPQPTPQQAAPPAPPRVDPQQQQSPQVQLPPQQAAQVVSTPPPPPQPAPASAPQPTPPQAAPPAPPRVDLPPQQGPQVQLPPQQAAQVVSTPPPPQQPATANVQAPAPPPSQAPAPQSTPPRAAPPAPPRVDLPQQQAPQVQLPPQQAAQVVSAPPPQPQAVTADVEAPAPPPPQAPAPPPTPPQAAPPAPPRIDLPTPQSPQVQIPLQEAAQVASAPPPQPQAAPADVEVPAPPPPQSPAPQPTPPQAAPQTPTPQPAPTAPPRIDLPAPQSPQVQLPPQEAAQVVSAPPPQPQPATADVELSPPTPTQAPRPAEQVPRPTEQSPAPTEQFPRSTEQVPPPTEQSPRPTEQFPRSTEQVPRSTEQVPRSTEQVPPPTEQSPRSTEQFPRTTAQGPQPTEQSPPPTTQLPRPPQATPTAPADLNLPPREAPRVEIARPAPAQIAPADVPEAGPPPSKAPVAAETAPPQPPPSLAKYVAVPLPEELGGDTVLARVVTDDVEAPPQPAKTPPAAGQVIVADAEPDEDGANGVLRLFDRTVRLEVPAGTRVALRIEAVVPDLGLPSGWLRDFSVQTLLDAGIPPTPDRVAAVQRAADLVPPHLAEGVRALATMLVAKGLPVEPRGIRELAMRNPEGVQRLASLGRLVRLSELAGVSLPSAPGSDAASIATLGERVAQSLSAARTAGAAAPALDALLRRIPEPTPAPVPVTDLATSLTRELSSLDVDLPAETADRLPDLKALLGTPIPPHVISDLLSPPPSTGVPSEDALLRNLVGLLRPVVDRGAEALRDTLARAVQTALTKIPREGIESLVRSLEAMPSNDPVRGLLLEQARRALAGTADAAVERVLAEVERGGGLRELTARVREALEGADRRTLASVRSALAEKERTTLRETPGLPQLQSLYGEARALFDRLGALKLMDVATLPRDEKALHFQLPLVVDGQIRNAQLRVTYRERRDDEGARSRYEMTGMVLRVELSRLGPVTSKVDVRGEGLSVVFRVDTPEVKALLEAGRGDLETALRELGRDAVVRVAMSGPDDVDPFVPPPVRALADVDVTA